jgi:hypothetical protein
MGKGSIKVVSSIEKYIPPPRAFSALSFIGFVACAANIAF